jgi:histidinol-phosphate aminotransferase
VSSAKLSASARSFDPQQLVRESLRRTHAYTPAVIPDAPPPRLIKLDMNESPYGPSPKTRAALAAFSETNRYPDFGQTELRDALGRYVGRDPDTIICGAGLDDVLNTVMHAIIAPGDEVIISDPTFGVYRMLISLYDGVAVNVPLGEDFALRPQAVLDAVTDRTKLIVICTPNNPTGNVLDAAAIEQVVEGAPCLVAIDEAYAEFSHTSHVYLMDDHPNVAIFRTMSKFAGLAGMRVGYGVFSPEMARLLGPVVPAFHNVAMASRVAAIASLDDLDYLNGIIERIVADRDILAANLAEIPGVRPLPSATNFLLVELPAKEAKPVIDELARRGIFVRSFPQPDYGLHTYLRVTVGSTDDNDAFVNELNDILTGAGRTA